MSIDANHTLFMGDGNVTQAGDRAASAVLNTPGLVSFWDFQEPSGESPTSQGKERYVLQDGNGAVAKANEGVFGPAAADIRNGQWYRIARADCPSLDFHGETAFTLCAWLKRFGQQESTKCEAVVGMWDETYKHRQYCMFLNLRIWDSAQQLCGHVSAEGGPTPEYKYCMTSAIGQTEVSFEEWHFAVFTFDGEYAKVFLDGQLDERETFNPYLYPKALHNGGSEGSDFTIAGVNRSGEMGNFYEGLLGGLAVYDRCLSADEITALYQATRSIEMDAS
ncbi:LamG domain-containing protein [Paenibacillus periandrae]|uniref:LamG domain-containing protein n=1 Tax=Paenibacillus periandrae TaxID=1761741 RepID=UPI001F095E02|nr:LamG domain-containing protein [Paenibacillus periandrae]